MDVILKNISFVKSFVTVNPTLLIELNQSLLCFYLNICCPVWALMRDSAELFSLLLIGPNRAGSVYYMLGTNASSWGEITHWVKRMFSGFRVVVMSLSQALCCSLFDCCHCPFEASGPKIMFAGASSIAVCHHFTAADVFSLFLCEAIGLPFLCCYYHLFCLSTRWQKRVTLQACYRFHLH